MYFEKAVETFDDCGAALSLSLSLESGVYCVVMVVHETCGMLIAAISLIMNY